jgi:hypothetical protein
MRLSANIPHRSPTISCLFVGILLRVPLDGSPNEEANVRTDREQLWWIFRVGVAMCFIGHGMFGVITKEEWVPFFEAVGLSRDAAFMLMPVIGMLDIAIGLSVLFRPTRVALLYMTMWAFWTAALRPLTGLSVFEMLERAGNYGLPLAFLVFLGAGAADGWFSAAKLSELAARDALVSRLLAATTALLLAGHGALAFERKPLLLNHAASVGLGADSVAVLGAIEIALAGLVLLAPRPSLLFGIAAWKIATESLFIAAGAPIWEFIERGGSYAAPLALALLLVARRPTQRSGVTLRAAGTLPVVAVALLLLTVPSEGHAQSRIAAASPGIVDSLLRGGFVIACRHATTNHDESDRGRDRSDQRNLTPAGEAQAKGIGAAIRELRIPIGDVHANPMYRTRETATYAFGHMTIDSSITKAKALRALLMAPVSRGTNRAIVARIGTLSEAMGDHGVQDINEGDCFVIQSLEGRDFQVIARIAASEWQTLGR